MRLTRLRNLRTRLSAVVLSMVLLINLMPVPSLSSYLSSHLPVTEESPQWIHALLSGSAVAQAASFAYETTERATIGNNVSPCTNPVVRTFDVDEDFTVNDLDVGINISHSYRSDLRVTLQSPAGTRVQLISTWFDSNDNYDLLLDSSSRNPLNDGDDDNIAAPYYDRTAAPSESLDVFIGEDARGQWRLEICNYFTTNNTFQRAQLRFDGTPTRLPSGRIAGTVFRDYNNDGIYDGAEPGIANVAVSAIDQFGTKAATITGPDGTYLIPASAGLVGAVRLEFTLPADSSLDFLQAGAAGGSTVQFVDVSTGLENQHVGFYDPVDYCQADPPVAVTNFYDTAATGAHQHNRRSCAFPTAPPAIILPLPIHRRAHLLSWAPT